MKKKGIIFYVIISVLILSTISIIYSLVFLNEPKVDKKVSFAVSLIRLIFSISTFIIAILLYDRFSFRKNIYERKLEIVIDVLIKIKELRVSIVSVNKKETLFGGIDIQKKMKTQYIVSQINEYSLIVFDPINIYTSKSILAIKKLKNNPFLPKEISESLEFLFPLKLTGAELHDEYSEKFVQIDFGNESKLKIINIQDWFYPDKGMTFKLFIENFENVLKTIESWLDSHSSIKSDLNI